MFNDIRKNENKGFSLVELIVVIAIMAVMTAVLAPSLLQYVEKSRKQKDDSAMGELVQVVKLALAEQDVYDECLRYTIENNVDTYVARVDDNGTTDTTDDVTNADEEPWDLTGNMRGLTITFHRFVEAGQAAKGNNSNKYVLANGIVNEYIPNAVGFNGDAANGTLGAMTTTTDDATTYADNELYTRVLAGIGDEIVLTSQTYRNSDYTIFIEMGSAIDAVNVYGKWNGTNLHTTITTPSAKV